MSLRTAIKVSIILLITVLVGGLAIGHYRSRANTKEIALTDLADYQAYEKLDRQQGDLKAQLAQLNLMNNVLADRKAEIRKRLNVPENFKEKREDPKNDNSPVVAFVDPATLPAEKQ